MLGGVNASSCDVAVLRCWIAWDVGGGWVHEVLKLNEKSGGGGGIGGFRRSEKPAGKDRSTLQVGAESARGRGHEANGN